MCSQNDQREVGIILSRRRWGRPRPPPPPGTARRAPLAPLPSRHGDQGGWGGWANAYAPPRPPKQSSSRPVSGGLDPEPLVCWGVLGCGRLLPRCPTGPKPRDRGRCRGGPGIGCPDDRPRAVPQRGRRVPGRRGSGLQAAAGQHRRPRPDGLRPDPPRVRGGCAPGLRDAGQPPRHRRHPARCPGGLPHRVRRHRGPAPVPLLPRPAPARLLVPGRPPEPHGHLHDRPRLPVPVRVLRHPRGPGPHGPRVGAPGRGGRPCGAGRGRRAGGLVRGRPLHSRPPARAGPLPRADRPTASKWTSRGSPTPAPTRSPAGRRR